MTNAQFQTRAHDLHFLDEAAFTIDGEQSAFMERINKDATIHIDERRLFFSTPTNN